LRWDLVHDSKIAGTFFNAVSFWDQDSGIAISDPVDGAFVFYTTDDSGLRWHEMLPKTLLRAEDGEFLFAASNSCMAVQGKNSVWFATGGKNCRLFSSNDRGRNGQAHTHPMQETKGENYSGIHSLAFYNEKIGIAVGGSAGTKSGYTRCNAMTTQDGGTTWQRSTDLAGALPFRQGYSS
jgi:photosystem II stability/assembly factor-like uncharacterized protein